jgi:hypothetical protein
MNRGGESPGVSGPGTLRRLAEGWNRFWFQPADPTLLGFMRICCGLVVLYIHLVYTSDLQQFFGKNAWVDKQAIDEFRHEFPWEGQPSGWQNRQPILKADTPEEREYMFRWSFLNPRMAYAKGYPAWSIWFHVTDPAWMMAIHCGVLAVMFLFTIGFCTRVTSVLTWLGVLSYVQRSPVTLYGMDAMMNILLIYLMIGPSGAAFSVDRLIARYWATRRALSKHQPVPLHLPPAPRVSANLALRLMQVHFCIIYMASGLSKLLGHAWWNGTAVWATMAVYEYTPMAMASYQAFLLFLAQHRWLWEIVMTGGVAYTLITEISVPFLIWNRKLRWVMITMAVGLHTGIAVVMGLRTFSLFMLVMLTAFVPQETVQALMRRLAGRLSRFRLGINDQVRSQVRAASIIRAFDAFGQVEILDHTAARRLHAHGQGEEPAAAGKALSPAHLRLDSASAGGGQMELVTPEGEILSGYRVFERLTRSVRLLWPVALVTWIPGMPSLARRWHASETPRQPAASPRETQRQKAPVAK